MARLLGVLLLAGLYSFFAVWIVDAYSLAWMLLLVLLILLFVCGVVMLVRCTAPKKNIEKKCRQMRRVMLFVKLAGVPLFVLNFLLWTSVISLVTFLPGAIIAWLTPGPWLYVLLIVVLTYFAMIETSFFSISAIALYYKAGMLKKWETALHVVLQLIFVADVVDAVYLFVVLRRREKEVLKVPVRGDTQGVVSLQSAPAV